MVIYWRFCFFSPPVASNTALKPRTNFILAIMLFCWELYDSNTSYVLQLWIFNGSCDFLLAIVSFFSFFFTITVCEIGIFFHWPEGLWPLII